MNLKLIKITIISLFFTLSNFAQAGLITDTSESTFIDQSTKLEWMDFGINDSHSYNEVKSLLTTTYAGWALATSSQVFNLWSNAFSGVGSNTDRINASGPTFAYYNNTSPTNTDMLEVFAKMGYSFNNGSGSHGWFANNDGLLDYVHFHRYGLSDAESSRQTAQIYGPNTNNDNNMSTKNSYYSTMLVRKADIVSPNPMLLNVRNLPSPMNIVVEAPEPTTFAIFALGMIGLIARRYTQKTLSLFMIN